MSRRILLVSLALLFFPAAASAQFNVIKGKVRSTNNTTLNNAIVELRISGGGNVEQTVTRNDGDFAFSGLVSAQYEIVVSLAGFESTVQYARFNHPSRDGVREVVNVEIILRPRAEPSLASPGTSFAQDVPKSARAAYEKAMTKLREGGSDEAITLLREATAIFDDYFDARFALATELFRAGKEAEALQELERARQINDREGAVYHLFGLVMLKQRKFAVAEYAFREATRLNANNASSHFYRGLALIELVTREADERQRAADMDEAERALNHAFDLSGKRMTAVYLQRARIHERRGDKEAAARDLEQYLKAEPEAKNGQAIREAIMKLRGPKVKN